MTNFERIKNMSVDEMALFFCNELELECRDCIASDDCHRGHNGFKTWLTKKLDDEKVQLVRCGNCTHWVSGVIDDKDNFIPPKCKLQSSTWDSYHSNHYCAWGEQKQQIGD